MSPQVHRVSGAAREAAEREAADVLEHYRLRFDAERSRFPDGARLLARYASASELVVERGSATARRGREEAHNELCVADALLTSDRPRFSRVRYEPPLPGTARTIDFRAEASDRARPLSVWVDVKTIEPATRDRWDQYVRALNEQHFPATTTIHLEREWLGGELWHHAYASRSKMLEYTIELEAKIAAADALTDADEQIFLLALCGSGFHWHVDELEDFVAYYRTGRHRQDDPFAKMERRHLSATGQTLSWKVTGFACLQRAVDQLVPSRVIWNVAPPPEPWHGLSV